MPDDRLGKVDLNSASLEDLRDIEGIGPGRAEAIVRHRQEHGRFTALDELDRVPHFSGMPAAERERVKQRLEVRPGVPAAVEETVTGPLNVNRATPEELMRIPGLGAARTNEILRHREERGAFNDLDELDELPHFHDMPQPERRAIKEQLTIG